MKCRKLAIIALVLSLLVFSACAPEDDKTDLEIGADYLKGTRGIDINLEEPGTLFITPDQPVSILAEVENLGRHTPDSVDFYLSGFDPKFLDYGTDVSRSLSEPLQGKTKFSPGISQIVSFTGIPDEANIGDLGTPKLQQDTIVTMCYDYSTRASFPVCLDTSTEEEPGGCPKEASVAYEEGQGAPLAITKVDYRTVRASEDTVRVRFDIHLRQVDNTDNLRIFDSESASPRNPCEGVPLKRLDYGKIDILSVDFRGGEELECPLLTSLRDSNQKFNIERLDNPVLTCYNKEELPVSPDINTVLNIEIAYDVVQSVVQPVVIESIFT
ncbi:hypothetical protein GF371_03655 [Candidatus Woesearchaeota archaeon]|nr:hypothetical protein [Candidatus Woesearchaeota archaeon]